MRTVKPIYFAFAAALIVFSSCKNDLKLNAPYKEYPSIYAILNPQEPVQTIRINKVFLGEGNANTMAKVADSVNYPAGEISVKLQRFYNGQQVVATPSGNKTEIVFTESVITTDSGPFATTQRLYVTSDKLYTSGEYKLIVTNVKTNNVFTAKANALDSVGSSGYTPFEPRSNYYGAPENYSVTNLQNTNIWIDYSNVNTPYPYVFRVKPNDGIIYQSSMKLYYLDSLNSGQVESRSVYYNFARQNKKDAVPQGNLGPFLVNNFTATDILNTMAEALEKNSRPISEIVGRRLYRIDFLVYSSTQDYLDYLEYSAPSLSIAQNKPMYSNFDGQNALGIFTFRTHCIIPRNVNVDFVNRLATSCITHKYKFLISPQLTWPANCQ